MSKNRSNDPQLPLGQWSAAVFAGLSLLGCPDQAEPTAADGKHKQEPAHAAAEPTKDAACCMGLNECKGKGGCAVPESHACAGKNECKGKGGCNMHCPK